MIGFSFEIDVARSPAEVFEYLADPANLREWQGTAAVEKLSDGPVAKGTRFREVHRRMGRSLASVTEVTTYEPDRRFGVRVVEGPVPVDGLWDLVPDGAGTRLRFTAAGRASGPLRLAEPLLARVAERQMRKDHQRLKQALESRS